MPAQVKFIRMTSRSVHVREKKWCFFSPFDGREGRWFFLVVGVLIWTISAILLWRAFPHWWGCIGQKTYFGFDVF
jgi:hypothetical protein